MFPWSQVQRCRGFEGAEQERCMRYMRQMYNDCVTDNCVKDMVNCGHFQH